MTESGQRAHSLLLSVHKARKKTTFPRRRKRVDLMQDLFAYSFRTTPESQADFLKDHPSLKPHIPLLAKIDEQIHQIAPQYPLSQLNKVDLAILRAIMLEWEKEKTPKAVLISEAVELGKDFGGESSASFVNGVLAKLQTQEKSL